MNSSELLLRYIGQEQVNLEMGSHLERQGTLAGVIDDPRLNPERPEFNIYIGARAFMRAMDEGHIKAARASFPFKNLNVSWTGSAVSLQKNITPLLLASLRLGKYVNFGKKSKK